MFISHNDYKLKYFNQSFVFLKFQLFLTNSGAKDENIDMTTIIKNK